MEEEVSLEERTYIALERLCPLSYVQPDSYMDRMRKERRDIQKFVPFATVKKFPRSGNEGLYGWTYRYKDGSIRMRDDLIWHKKRETDMHESAHTPDERETRYRTEEKMEWEFPVKKKYEKKVEYIN